METAGQIVSIAGMIMSVISFQCKKNGNLYLCQSLSGLLFSLSYFLLGAFSGSYLNLINVFRGLLFASVKSKKPRFAVMLGTVTAYTIATVFSYAGVFSVLVFCAQLVGTVLMWYNDGKVLRIGQLAFVSPIWLSYNIYCMMIGGILCECFAITSTVISLIRFRKYKLDE